MVSDSFLNPEYSLSSIFISSGVDSNIIPLQVESVFFKIEQWFKPKYLKYPLISAGIIAMSCFNNFFNADLL